MLYLKMSKNFLSSANIVFLLSIASLFIVFFNLFFHPLLTPRFVWAAKAGCRGDGIPLGVSIVFFFLLLQHRAIACRQSVLKDTHNTQWLGLQGCRAQHNRAAGILTPMKTPKKRAKKLEISDLRLKKNDFCGTLCSRTLYITQILHISDKIFFVYLYSKHFAL